MSNGMMNVETGEAQAIERIAPNQSSRTMIDVAQTRAAQEAQGAMVIAKKFPRDEDTAYLKIRESCKRKALAEVAMYAYPRGNTTVTGPSIRLAETIARYWGNLDYGIVELEQRHGESIMEAYCWDMETNNKVKRIFTVKHFRQTKAGGYALTDPRDIYELTANQGARRLRACILSVIPGDIIDGALDQCDETLTKDVEPIGDRLRKMLEAFQVLGVTKEMVEKRLGHNLDVTTETEILQLRKIYTSIKDNAADRAEFFEMPQSQSKTDSLKEKLKADK